MERGVVVVEEDLKVVYKSVNVDVKGFNLFLPIVEKRERGVEGKVSPQNVDDGIGIGGRWGDVRNGGGSLQEGRNYEDHSQERETVSLAE